MTREQRASILGEVIKHARQGKTQAQIAKCIGVNPSMVYKICKRYGIRTKHMLRKESQKAKKLARPVQCLLPM